MTSSKGWAVSERAVLSLWNFPCVRGSHSSAPLHPSCLNHASSFLQLFHSRGGPAQPGGIARNHLRVCTRVRHRTSTASCVSRAVLPTCCLTRASSRTLLVHWLCCALSYFDACLTQRLRRLCRSRGRRRRRDGQRRRGERRERRRGRPRRQRDRHAKEEALAQVDCGGRQRNATQRHARLPHLSAASLRQHWRPPFPQAILQRSSSRCRASDPMSASASLDAFPCYAVMVTWTWSQNDVIVSHIRSSLVLTGFLIVIAWRSPVDSWSALRSRRQSRHGKAERDVSDREA